MLADTPTIAFVATLDAARAKEFYSQTLGLPLVGEDGFALVFTAGDRMFRVVIVEEFSPQPFTVLGWEVADIEARIDDLVARGISFERFAWMDQDDRGIWTTPNGDRVAWFTDPDGNVLSLSSHSPV